MVRYASAATAVVLTFATLRDAEPFRPAAPPTVVPGGRSSSLGRGGKLSVSVSATGVFDDSSSDDGDGNAAASSAVQSAMRGIEAGYAALTDEYEDDYEAEQLRRKSAAAAGTAPRRRFVGGGTMYDVTVPLQPNGAAASPTTLAASDRIGLTLRQVDKNGRMSDLALDLDTLDLRSLGEEMLPATASAVPGNDGAVEVLDSESFGPSSSEKDDGCSSPPPLEKGVVVSGVVRGSTSWESGVRPGDVLLATSATMGRKMWPKTTLDGVRSAVSSRRVMSNSIQLQFRRSATSSVEDDAAVATASVEEFEMQLARPLGIQVEDTEGGYVQITGFAETAPTNDISSLRVGDRIVAVDSSLGTSMWPVSNVAGLVSACTSRLPGQTVRLRFERVADVGECSVQEEAGGTTGAGDDSAGPTAAAMPVQKPAAVGGTKNHRVLLSRCRDVLKRYAAGGGDRSVAGGAADGDVTVAVADKVLNALADASAPLDAKTLYMVMNAYLSSRRPDRAIRAFEAAVGLSADGSSAPAGTVIASKAKEGDRIMPDLAALNLFTATALLRAHAMRGDGRAALRVLASMEGREDYSLDGVGASSWPRGAGGENWVTDARCYNVVLSAAAKMRGKAGLDMAAELFESMAEPSSSSSEGVAAGKPAKDAVSYNTMIGAFAKAGRVDDAFEVFYRMKQAGLKPDKFSYTSLIKALVKSGDVDGGRAMLNDMESEGVEADVLSYNTVIKGLCDRYKWYEAKELVTEMEWNGVSPDSFTYGMLMNGLLKAGKPGPALTLFETACSDPGTLDLAQNVQIYTTAVTAASMMGDHARAIGLVARMVAAGIQPNLKTFTSLMGGCLSSGKTSYALEIFGKISDPDGYALELGIRAFCDTSDYTSAASILSEQRGGNREMSGKQVMASYNYLVRSALENNEYAVARTALTELLESGYIPSKNTLKIISEALGLIPKKGTFRPPLTDENKAESESTFDFLLFVLDSMGARKLPINGSFYASIIFEGARIGGLRKKISSLIAEARSKSQSGKQIDVSEAIICGEEGDVCIGWEDLVQNYANYKDKIGKEISLPTVNVRTSERELRAVLAAEMKVSYGNRRPRKVLSGWKSRR